MKTITKKLLIIWVMFLCVVVFAADVPKSINYQGLLSEDGRAVNGSRDITFRLYDAFDAEISFWDRTESVEIIDGVFNELLGPFNTAQLDKFATSVDGVYLEIEVDSEVFPRQQMLSVGYAFRAQTAAGIDNNAITSAKITDGTIVSADIQNKTIQIEDLADEVLDGGGVANGSITTSKLADGAVTSQKIAYETIVSTNIKDNAIGSSEIATNAVDSDEIATDAVGSDEIATDAVGSDEIATGAVDSDEIANGAVTAAKLASIPSSIPTGGIIMWSGAIGTIPSGWALCDGSNETPDLTDKFIVCSGGSYPVGPPSPEDDGENEHTISEDTDEDGKHSHGHDLGITGGNHAHDVSGTTEPSPAAGPLRSGGGAGPNYGHKHDFDVSTSGDNDGAHSHDISGGITDTNSEHMHHYSFTFDNRPPYYALAFIMKLP